MQEFTGLLVPLLKFTRLSLMRVIVVKRLKEAKWLYMFRHSSLENVSLIKV